MSFGRKNDSVSSSKKNKSKHEKREHTTFKYSHSGKGDLYEAAILAGVPTFIAYSNGEIKLSTQIEQSSRIIKPPHEEEYPYKSYEFADSEEVNSYAIRASKESIDSLYEKAISIVQKYNDQDKYKINLITADIIWSYFQDRFSTTHYVCVTGDNGSGKSTIGDTFEAIGYRVVNITDPTAANIFRLLGKLEPGQCTIIIDEAERIDQSQDIISTLKTGYSIKGKVARINMNNLRQEFFYTYCFKMIIGERSPNSTKAKGVLDRTFTFTSYKGISDYDIKEVLNPASGYAPYHQKLLDEIIDFRKLIMMYRLIHFKDPIPNIQIDLDGRNKELCKPLLQLFQNTNAEYEIECSLQKLLDEKNQRKRNSIEATLYPIIINLLSENGKAIYSSQIWNSIIQNIEGAYDEKKPNEFQSYDFGTLYRNTITNIICDEFGANRKHTKNGTLLIFDRENLLRVASSYDLENRSIQTKISECIDNPTNDGGEGSESSDGSIRKTTSYSRSDYNDVDNTIVVTSIVKQNDNYIHNNKETGIIKRNNNNDDHDNNNQSLALLEPSHLSLSSPPLSEITQNITEDNTQKETIYRLGHSDTWACRNCKVRDDVWFMKIHRCSGSKVNHSN
jgi:hypothetical protein